MTHAETPIPIFLINLDRSQDRLAEFTAQAHALELHFERFPAIDGRGGIPPSMRGEFEGSGHLSNGEVGCYASHLSIAQRVVDQNLYGAIVLEDDAVLDEAFAALARQAVGRSPPDWDIIHFSTDFKRPAYRISELGLGRDLIRHSRLPANTAAYAISRSGAVKLCRQGIRRLPIDMEFRYAWLRELEVFGVYPAIAQQRRGTLSTIDATSTARAFGNIKRVKHQKPDGWSQVRGWLYVMKRLGLAANVSRLTLNSDGRWVYPVGRPTGSA